MLYFNENSEYIFAECESCKSEMYIERGNVGDENAFMYKCRVPLRCACGEISAVINKSGKSCYSIRQELSALSELLHRQKDAADKIASINSELNKKVRRPNFAKILLADLLFSLKFLLVLGGIVIGAEIVLFVISCLMFFFGMAFTMPDLSLSGNNLFYNLNIFKDRGGEILKAFGFDTAFPRLAPETAKKEIVTGYIPYAVAGILLMVFYVFLAVLIIRLIISFIRFGFFMSRVIGKNVVITAKKQEYLAQLDLLGKQYNDLGDQIKEQTILFPDYKNIKAADTILMYFYNNRVDTIKDALNLFHEEDLKVRSLDYQKAIYNELRQTKRYVKALYVMTSDENAKVDVREEPSELDEIKISDMIKGAYKKLRRKNASEPAVGAKEHSQHLPKVKNPNIRNEQPLAQRLENSDMEMQKIEEEEKPSLNKSNPELNEPDYEPEEEITEETAAKDE